MNVLFRLLKLIGIALLILLNENRDHVFKSTLIPDRFITGLIGFFIFFLIAQSLRDLLLYLYRKRKSTDTRSTDNVTVGIDNMYILLIASACFYTILHLLNLKPKDFFTGITLISAAIAIIMKDYISNIISGMILAFSDKLKIGDYVQVGQFKGEIVDFSLTTITLKNDDDETVYIPTNTVFAHELVNFTGPAHDTVTVDFELNNRMKIPFDTLKEKIEIALLPYLPYFIDGSNAFEVSMCKQESTIFKYRYVLRSGDLAIARQIQATILRVVYENTSMNKV